MIQSTTVWTKRFIVDEYMECCLHYDSKFGDCPHFTHTHSVVAEGKNLKM